MRRSAFVTSIRQYLISKQFVSEHKTELKHQNDLINRSLQELDEQETLEATTLNAAMGNIRQLLTSSQEAYEKSNEQVQRIGEGIIDEIANAALQNAANVSGISNIFPSLIVD